MKDDTSKDRIEIDYQPIRKIVVLDRTQFSIDEFFQRVELIVKAGQQLILSWAEGIVFFHIPYQPNSDIIIEAALKGTQYWGAIVFAPMPKYEPVRKFGAREIMIINQTSQPHLRQVAQWLKEKIKQ